MRVASFHPPLVGVGVSVVVTLQIYSPDSSE